MADVVRLQDPGAQGALGGCSCAFGVFDGFHRGHRYIVDRAIEYARDRGCPSAVITFDIDPDELFCAGDLVKLESNEQRLDRLAQSGVDILAVLSFTREFAALSPEDFLQRTFGAGVPAALHVGEDFRFGYRAQGTVETLKRWGSAHGVYVRGYDLLQVDGAPVTSTRIRALLAQGQDGEANDLLSRR